MIGFKKIGKINKNPCEPFASNPLKLYHLLFCAILKSYFIIFWELILKVK